MKTKLCFLFFLSISANLPAFEPANPRASATAKQVYHYLCTRNSFDHNRVFSGQNCRHGNQIVKGYPDLVDALYEETGHYPAFAGVDYEYIKPYSVKELSEANAVLIQHWDDGGLVTINWAPYNPWTGNNCRDLDRVDLNELVDPSTAVYHEWHRSLDRIAEGLLELRDAGVIVVWRPLQEVNGDWFWWGAAAHVDDDQPFKNLWQDMFTYFSEEKGLDNLIWELSVVESFLAGHTLEWYYPGDDYVDMIGTSVYKNTFANNNYFAMLSFGKPVAACETGPDHCCMDGTWDNMTVINGIRNYSPHTVYFHHWHDWPDHYVAIVSNLNASQLMDDPWVITREEVDWRPDTTNQPPLVRLTAPVEKPVQKGDTVKMTAEADDMDGSIVAVQFCDGYEILGKDDTPPYEFDYRDVPRGTLHLNARAIDNKKAVSISKMVNIQSAPAKPESNNLIRNGEYDMALASWGHWGHGSTDFVVRADAGYRLSGRHSARLEIIDGGASRWMCQFKQSFIMQKDAQYQVFFQAAANQKCPITVMFQQADGPYTEYWQKTINVDTAAKTFGPFIFNCGINDDGAEFKWWVGGLKEKTVWLDSVVVIDRNTAGIQPAGLRQPGWFELAQNFPNPYNPSTTITYQLAADAFVSLQIFDLQGRLVKTCVHQRQKAGRHKLEFSNTGRPSGVYFYKMTAGGFSAVRKMLFIR